MSIANDDASGLDYSPDEGEAEAREREIRGAIAEIQREEVGTSDRDNEFSSRPCACCGTHLAGARHQILGSSRER
ncbi:hypothetical protein ACFPTY_10175 [Halomonas beimenensis]|uniref:hypothetical protein n=1 Tax=Halomonas beimenensis TaxID=475662 RepID=UPI003389AE4D